MERSSARAPQCGGIRHLVALAAVALLGAPAAAPGSERDICENKTGAELIRCIEAAARKPAPSAPAAAPGDPMRTTPQRASPPPAARASSIAPGSTPPRVQPEDCSGRSGEPLRRCLAAGGRLVADPAGAALPAPARPADPQGCEGGSAEALRQCIDAQSRRAAAARTISPSQVVPCTGYTVADQPLCVHRNATIVECRNRSLYPDFAVCVRSHMANAPEPQRAECGKLPVRARAHCAARNRVFSVCAGERMGYFACLERQLGPDAVLTAR